MRARPPPRGITRPLTDARNTRLKVYDGTGWRAASEAEKRRLSDSTRRLRTWTYVNSWHMSAHESAAMWRHYGDSVVVRSTFGRLERCLSELSNVAVGEVEYLDFEHDTQAADPLAALMTKRKSFEYEREVRALMIDERAHLLSAVGSENSEDGRLANVDLTELVDEIRVAPQSEAWHLGVVEALVARHGLKVRVCRSDLDKDPVF